MAGYNIKELKSGGLMKQKEKDLFSIRLRVVGGKVNARQFVKLASIADKYGRGHLHLTTRQGIEIPYVHFDNIEKVREELREEEIDFGACGPRVRTVTACQGGACTHGFFDPQEMAPKIDKKYFGLGGYPHKFKIGITGCPNACIKPLENDLGIMGVATTEFLEEKCDGEGICLTACKVEGAIRIEDSKAVFDKDKCVLCGKCAAICPKGAILIKDVGYTVFIGGKMGMRPRFGDKLISWVDNEEKLLGIIDATLNFYKECGKEGERFGETIDRIGWDESVKRILATSPVVS